MPEDEKIRKERSFSDLLHRYREREGLAILFPDWEKHPELEDPVTVFVDGEEASRFVAAHVEWELGQRLIRGDPPFPLPKDYVTRLEVHRISIRGRGRQEVAKSMEPASLGPATPQKRGFFERLRHPFG